MERRRELGVVSNCCLCDALSVIVIATLPPAKDFQGSKGKKSFDDLVEKIQRERFLERQRHEKIQRERFLGDDWAKFEASAFCTDSVAIEKGREKLRTVTSRQAEVLPYSQADVKQIASLDNIVTLNPCFGQEYSSDRKTETVFSPCTWKRWAVDELPALYVNINQHEDPPKKPKWSLVQGLGPQTLELDSSRSGRLYKPALREVMDPRQCLTFAQALDLHRPMLSGVTRGDGGKDRSSQRSGNNDRSGKDRAENAEGLTENYGLDFAAMHEEVLAAYETFFVRPSEHSTALKTSLRAPREEAGTEEWAAQFAVFRAQLCSLRPLFLRFDEWTLVSSARQAPATET